MSTNKADKKHLWKVGIFWFFVGSYALFFYFTPANPYHVWFGFLLLLIGVWLHPLKGEKFFENRVSKFRNHKTRAGLTLAGLLVAIASFGINLQQYGVENYPTPSFILLSPKNVSEASLDYELKLQAEDATSVVVEGQGVMTQSESDPSVYELMINLDSPTSTFNVIAKNEHKQSETSVQITREETQEEEEERLAKQAELEEKLAQQSAPKTLGISYDQVMESLTDFFVMEKTAPLNDGRERYMGQTDNDLAILEIIGDKADIDKTTLIIFIPSDNNDVVLQNSALALKFIDNAAPNWAGANDWLNEAVTSLTTNPNQSIKTTHDNKLIEASLASGLGMLTFSVSPK